MFDRVVIPLLETALGLTGRIVKPALNLWCDCLEAIARPFR